MIADQKTQQIAAEWIAKFMAAVDAEDLAEMERIVSVVESSPNRAFRDAVLAQLEC